MSFSHGTVRGAAKVIAKKGDAWLGRIGIDVFGLRSGAAAPAPAAPQAAAPPAPPAPPTAEELAAQKLRKEYDAAYDIVMNADGHLSFAKRDNNAAVLALGPAFVALPDPTRGAYVTDLAAELDAMQPKLQAAR